MPIEKVTVQEKEAESVELLVMKPRRAVLCLGLINANGNSLACHDDCIKKAKKKAALLGADFIMREKAGTETSTYFNPGYSTYESSGSSFVSGNSGQSSESAYGYSVGPSVSTANFPWAVFSAWVYRPSTSGVDLDENRFVTGFRLQSNADEVGMKIGDKVIGIDGIDIEDDAMAQHLMIVLPGDEMVYSVLREGKRINFTIKAFRN